MSTTTNLALNEPAYNSTSPTWDQPLNYNSTILDQIFGNTTGVSVSTSSTPTYTNIAAPSAVAAGSTSQAMRFNLTGTLAANQTVLLPQSVAGMWVVTNSTSGAYTVLLGSNNGSNAAAGTTVSCPQGYSILVYCDGTNVKKADDGLISSALAVSSGGTGASTLTANNVILGNGTSAVQFVDPGTSGNVLTSNGTTWISSSLASGGTLIRAPQVLTSTGGGTYTTPAGCNHILIEMIGGGGGGGGVAGSTGGTSYGGGGGGSLFAVKYATVAPSTGYTYAVGAAGSGGNGGSYNGGAGGTSSITISGTTYSVSGGGGGLYSGSGAGTNGSTGTATNMDYSITPIIPAGGSGYGGCVDTPYGITMGGGYSNPIYQQIRGGYNGFGWGAGGSGAYNNAYSGAPTEPGGNGYQGMIRIWEYT